MDEERKGPKYRLMGLAVGSLFFAGSLLLKDYNQYIPHTAISTVSLVSAGWMLDYFLNWRHRNPRKERTPKEAKKPQVYQRSPKPASLEKTEAARAELLKRESELKRYGENLETGIRVAQSYIQKLAPEEYSKISKIEVIQQQKNRILGIPIGRNSLEVRIKR